MFLSFDNKDEGSMCFENCGPYIYQAALCHIPEDNKFNF